MASFIITCVKLEVFALLFLITMAVKSISVTNTNQMVHEIAKTKWQQPFYHQKL
jgi:hypothetical protein